MDESSKRLLTVAIPTVTVLVGILINNRQLDSLRAELRAELSAKFSELNGRIDSLNSRIDSLEIRIDSLEKVIQAKFDAVYARFSEAKQELLRVEQVMDARLRHLEER